MDGRLENAETELAGAIHVTALADPRCDDVRCAGAGSFWESFGRQRRETINHQPTALLLLACKAYVANDSDLTVLSRTLVAQSNRPSSQYGSSTDVPHLGRICDCDNHTDRSSLHIYLCLSDASGSLTFGNSDMHLCHHHSIGDCSSAPR